MKTKNVYSEFTRAFDNNFDNIYFPAHKNIKECQIVNYIDNPRALKMNIIECRRCHQTWSIFIHLWYKCIFFGNYESKQGCKNAADILQKKYLPNFEIIVEESFF